MLVIAAGDFESSRLNVQVSASGGLKLYDHLARTSNPDSQLSKFLGSSWDDHEFDTIIFQDQSQVPSFLRANSQEYFRSKDAAPELAEVCS